MARVYDWSFEVQDLLVYVTLRPRKRQNPSFLLRVDFEDFPRRAPSYVFVDPDQRVVTEEAWPPKVKHGDNQLDGICTPGTREFHEKWHKNDKRYPWDPERYSFLDTLQRIHNLIEAGIK